MDEAQILEHLLELAGEAGMKVRAGGSGRLGDDLPPVASGVCRVRGELWVVLAEGDGLLIQIDTLANALPPAVRAFLDPLGD